MAPDDLDIAGFAVGAVDGARLLGPERVRVGDVIVGLPSPGLRSNGYTLARHVLLERAGRSLGDPAWAGAGHTLADELLATLGDLHAGRVGGPGRAGGRRGRWVRRRARTPAPTSPVAA